MKTFGTITLQAKDESCDWRSFVICFDEHGAEWELRGYGKTPEEAASDAWQKYNDSQNWDIYGYLI